MHIATQHRTFIARNRRTGLLCHTRARPQIEGHLELVEIPEEHAARLQTARGKFLETTALADCEYVASERAEIFSLRKGGFFGAADLLTGAIVFDREAPSTWEEFYFVPSETARSMLSPIQDEHAFAERARLLREAGQPVRLQFGCGPRCIDGFLNIDKFPEHAEAANYFNFDFTEKPWPIPDASVDYIFSEDFIEHVPQKNQIAFLAEAFRVLKPGCYHRVNTPCLRQAMTRSDFSKGFAGVYFDEFTLWDHVALLTPAFLQELADMIGYRHVFFTTKNRGTSVYAVPDARPVEDRDELLGNIFADLLK